jgi:ATPase subunit of ABC transporter with duplicated ATPase domains
VARYHTCARATAFRLRASKLFHRHLLGGAADVSLKLAPGRHAGLIGTNGVGKTTLMRVLAGQLDLADGDTDVGSFAYMPQYVGVGDASVTVGGSVHAAECAC